MKFEPRTAARWYQVLMAMLGVDNTSAPTPEAEVTLNANASPPVRRDLVMAMPSKSPLRVFCLKMMYCWPAGEPPEDWESSDLNFIHASTVNTCRSMEGESGICTKLFVPSKLNA